MKKLPKETIQLISSSQVITSVYSAVKELFENSVDATATNIEVRLENFGLVKIEVLDNGCGIAPGDEEFVAKPHYTSKLKDDIDLKTLTTLGFRGEALHSLAAVSNLSFTTKTEGQQIGRIFFLNHEGSITKSKPCSRESGVTMIVEELFKNLPVRRQFYNCAKKNKDELRKIEHLLISYGLIRPELRIILKHNKSVIWQKSKGQSIRDSFISIFGSQCYGQMQEGTLGEKNENFEINFILPRKEFIESSFKASNDRAFFYVNERPVEIKAIFQVVKATYLEFNAAVSGKYPIVFIAITVPSQNVDVNVEPNKTQVLLENLEELVELIRKTIRSMCEDFGPARDVNSDEGGCRTADEVEELIALSDKEARENPIVRDSKISSSAESPGIANSEVENFFPTTPDFSISRKDASSNGGTVKNLHCEMLNGDRSKIGEESDVCSESTENEKSDCQMINNAEGNSICGSSFEIERTLVNNEANVSFDYQSKGTNIDTSLSLFSELSETFPINAEESVTVFGQRKEDAMLTKSATGKDHEKRTKSDLDEFFSVEEDESIFDEPLVNTSQGPRLKQISIENWSRGIGINDSASKRPIEPFQILQPDKKALQKKTGNKISPKVQSRMGLPSSKSSAKSVYRPEDFNLSFQLNAIREHFEEDLSSTSEDCLEQEDGIHEISVIGKISRWNLWVICQGGRMYLLNPMRAREDLIYHELMRKHVLPMNDCIVSLDHRLKNFDRLQSLRFECIPPDTGRCLVDKRITSNGFHVRQRKRVGTDETTYEILKLTDVVEDFGISELDEILEKMSCSAGAEEGHGLSLENCRPQKIVKYLKAEAHRLAQSSTNSFTRDDILELVQDVSLNNSIDANEVCLAGQPFICEFYPK